MQERNYIRKPDWLKIKVTGNKNNDEIEHMLKDLKLNTVCKEANCPNKMECYKSRTATFMILGENCTRNCRYCNVTTKRPEEVDPHEPENLAKAVKILGLRHAVITSVTRDDLADEGATQFRDVIRWVRKLNPETTVEVLIPDMHAKKELLDIVMDEKPDILNHNIETIERLFPEVRKEGNFRESIEVIKYAKEKGLKTKSGFMVGLGETKEEVLDLIKELYEAGCDYITIGQYLRPSLKHYEVKRYVHPDEFFEYEDYAKDIGIKKIAAGPFVRSSYKAAEMVDKK